MQSRFSTMFLPQGQPHKALLLAAIILLALSPRASQAANANRPHPHNGIIDPYDGAPPQVVLTDGETALVESGTPVYKQVEVSGGGRAVAVFKVDAPPKIIWSVISDFSKYPEWIKSLKKAKVYKAQGDKILVEFELSAGFFGKWTYFVEHTYPTEKMGWGTWKLDYSRQSDLDDSVGFWEIKPLNASGTQSLVSYSVEIRVGGWVPDFVKNLIVDGGLKEATQWVKIQSEKRVR